MSDTPTTTDTAAPATPPTPAEAGSKLAELTASKEWTAKLLSGDGQARREFDAIMAAKQQGDRTDAALAGTLEPSPFEITGQGKLATRDLISGIEHIRDVTGAHDEVIRQFLNDRPIPLETRREVENLQRKLHGDQEWVTRYLSGNYEARQQQTLITMALMHPVQEKN